MKKRFVTIGTSLASLALISSIAGTPVYAKGKDRTNPSISQSSGLSIAANLVKLSASLRHKIDKTIRNLESRDAKLTKRIEIQKNKGWNTDTAHAAVTDLEKQINILKGITVPGNPTSADELKIPKQQYLDARKAGLADAAKANKALMATAASH